MKPRKGYKKIKWLFGKEIEIPEEWEITELQHHAELYVPMRDKPKKFDGDIPWLRIEDLDEKYASDSKSNQRVSLATIKEMKLRVYPIGTVLCSCSATIGICAITTQKLITNQTFIGITPNDSLDNQFLYYFLTTQKNYLNTVSAGSTILYISRKKFERMRISLPSISEQQKISSILSNVDNLINSIQKVIDQTKSIKKGLMQELLIKGIGHSKFKKIKSYYKQYQEIPQDWDQVVIDDVLEIRGRIGWKGMSTKDYRQKGPILIGVTNISKNFRLALTKITRISEERYDESPEIMVQNNDILLAKSGATTGKVCIVENLTERATVNAAVNILRTKDNTKSFPKFFYYYLSWNHIQIRLFSLSSAGAQPNLFQRDTKKIKLILPSIDEQQKIASILSNVDSQIISQTQYKEKLERLKKSLMQKLLTGQVRVTI